MESKLQCSTYSVYMDNNLLEKWKVTQSLPIPLYKQLAKNIHFTISLGHVPPGTKLPPVKTLAKSLNLSNDTIRSAYKLLEEMGLIITRPYHGTETVSLLSASSVDKSPESSYVFSFQRIISEFLKEGKSIEEINGIYFESIEQLLQKPEKNPLLFVECDMYDKSISAQIEDYLNIPLDFSLLQNLDAIISKMHLGGKPYDAVITTYFHYPVVFQAFLPYKIPVYGVVIEMNDKTHNTIASLPQKSKVGILCQDIHNPIQLTNIIRGINNDVEVRSAKKSETNQYFSVLHWADALVVNHPCEKDVSEARPDCPLFFFYDQINQQSLELLKQNVYKIIKPNPISDEA